MPSITTGPTGFHCLSEGIRGHEWLRSALEGGFVPTETGHCDPGSRRPSRFSHRRWDVPLVPTLRVGMPSRTLCVLRRWTWPPIPTTQSVEEGIPTRSVGTRADAPRRSASRSGPTGRGLRPDPPCQPSLSAPLLLFICSIVPDPIGLGPHESRGSCPGSPACAYAGTPNGNCAGRCANPRPGSPGTRP